MLIPTLDQASLENAAFYAGMITAVFIVIIYSLNVLKEGAKEKRKYEKRRQRYFERQQWNEENKEKRRQERNQRIEENKKWEKEKKEFHKWLDGYTYELKRKEKVNREKISRAFKDIKNNI